MNDHCSGYEHKPHPEKLLRPAVLQSAARWYVGTFCNHCGPYRRISGYYSTEQQADEALTALNA